LSPGWIARTVTGSNIHRILDPTLIMPGGRNDALKTPLSA